MAYSLQKSPQGDLYLYSIDGIPMFEGDEGELSRQAIVSLTSALRHFAAADCMFYNGLDEADVGESPLYDEKMDLATEQLVATFMSLAALADYYNIDIQQEIINYQKQVAGGLPWD